MRLTIWRALVGLGIALGFAVTLLVSGELVRPQGWDGITATLIGGPQHEYVVGRVDPGSPAARAGIRAGDIIRPQDPSWAQHLEFRASVPGDTRRLIVTHDGRTRTVSFVEIPRWNLSSQVFTFVVVFTSFTLFVGAALIAIRASGQRAARLLAGFFVCLGLAINGQASLDMPQPWLSAAWLVLEPAFAYLAGANFSLFAAVFPEPGGRFRTLIERTTAPITAGLIGLAIYAQASLIFGTAAVQPWKVFPLYGFLLYIVASAIAFAIAERRSRGVDRQRVRWVAVSLLFGLSGPIALTLLVVSSVLDPAFDVLQLTMVAIPIGSAYAILRHRVIDLGFVVNRALVFAIVSAIVVTAMGILEWILEKVVVEQNHVTSVSLEVALALALGYFLRRIHGRIDAFVDYLFFRSRHRAERALRAFARDAHFITDLGPLLERTIQTVLANADASFAGLWLASPANAYVIVAGTSDRDAIDENDPAIVRLRSTSDAVDMSELHSALGGRLALPMPIRGKLSGFLVCGSKRSGEDFTPDEVRTLCDLAREVGLAVDGLRIESFRREVDRALRAGQTGEALRSVVELALAPPPRLETNQATAAS